MPQMADYYINKVNITMEIIFKIIVENKFIGTLSTIEISEVGTIDTQEKDSTTVTSNMVNRSIYLLKI